MIALHFNVDAQCLPVFAPNTFYCFIDGVKIGDIDNQNLGKDPFLSYADFSNLTTDLVLGSTQTIEIGIGSFHEVAVYIDYNQDNIYDASERVVFHPTSWADWDSKLNFQFTVPSSALTGSTNMRVIVVEDGFPIEPCYFED
tara:strand:- start:4103 stop:4528 length:426 start_codon:yes stop_codon:yes gene_type:complete